MEIGQTAGQYFKTTVQSLKKEFSQHRSDLEFALKKVSLNGKFMGVNGFISNPLNSKVVYLNTDVTSFIGEGPKILFRTAKSTKDHSGGHNQYARSPEELCVSVVALLA